MNNDLFRRFVANAVDKNLFPQNGIALVAVSGGADSVALLDLMVLGATELGLEIAVGHVNHGTGAWSDDGEAVVRNLASELGVRLHTRSVELEHDWTETEARELRMEAYSSLMEESGARYLATGHHLGDQVETLLLRFLKGSGIAGLSGILDTAGTTVRPLLPFDRREIDGWIAQRKLTGIVVSDPGNFDLRHDRNWIRHELIPLLSVRFGRSIAEGILQVGFHAQDDRQAWASVLRIPELEFGASKGSVEVARAPLQRYDKALCDAVLKALAREIGVVLGRKQTGLVRRFVADGTSGHSLDVGSNCRLELAFDVVRFTFPVNSRPPSGREVLWGPEGGALEWAGWRFSWAEEVVGAVTRRSNSTWLKPGTATIRSLAEGDRMTPLGGVGGRPVRRLFMEAGVSRSERWTHPVVTREGIVLWVPGVCRADLDVPNVGTKAIRIEASRI